MNRFLLPLAIATIATTAHASCGSEFCSVNTNWDTQGLSSNEGLRVDLRYSYARADQLRSGSSKITPNAPSGSDEEIENKRTINQVLNIDADYTINSRWNVMLGIPVISRDHTHTFDSSVSEPFTQQAKFTEIGDIRVVGRYKFDLGDMANMYSGSGIRFGLKLPTGAINKTMTPADPTGDPDNPTTPHPLDRASQPGTGSTDAILGAYYFHNFIESDWGWFASAQVQSAIATRDNFKPGDQLTFDLGLHYALAPSWNALLQLNAKHRARDTGANANPASGGYSVNLSPGLSYSLTANTQLYGLVQVPLKQYTNSDPAIAGSGQLTAPWSVAMGIAYRF